MSAALPREPEFDESWRFEQKEWLDALDDVLEMRGGEEAKALLLNLQQHLSRQGGGDDGGRPQHAPTRTPSTSKTQPQYPGDIELETRSRSNIIRWNAVAMVLQAFDSGSGRGRPHRPRTCPRPP